MGNVFLGSNLPHLQGLSSRRQGNGEGGESDPSTNRIRSGREACVAGSSSLSVKFLIDAEVTEVGEGVSSIDENVLVVKSEVQLVNDNLKAIDDKVQTIADGGQRLFSKSPTSSPTFMV